MKILTLIVTYNRKKFLEECLHALQNQSYLDFDILIIDNNSTDGTKEVCEKFLSNKVFYHNTGKNVGGAGGFAIGIKTALQKSYDYCWVMDDDTIPQPSSLESLVSKANSIKNQFSFLSSVVRWTDGSICTMNAQKIDTKWLGENEIIDKHLIKVTFCSFVGCFINLGVARNVGIPIAEMFIYGDDLEYTTRLNGVKQGYVDLDSVVIHKMAENKGTNIIEESKNRLDRYYYNFRNRIYICRKYGGLFSFIKGTFKLAMQILFRKNCEFRRKKLYVMTKGLLAGFFFNPVIVTKYNDI
ncbi:glycosyltransferase [Neobacillus niacini]|uniref:glycosyltransferase n=1 Tax=Neobacillus niacini TaxID=86668 RepID=UPI002FFFBCFD